MAELTTLRTQLSTERTKGLVQGLPGCSPSRPFWAHSGYPSGNITHSNPLLKYTLPPNNPSPGFEFRIRAITPPTDNTKGLVATFKDKVFGVTEMGDVENLLWKIAKHHKNARFV